MFTSPSLGARSLMFMLASPVSAARRDGPKRAPAPERNEQRGGHETVSAGEEVPAEPRPGDDDREPGRRGRPQRVQQLGGWEQSEPARPPRASVSAAAATARTANP